MACLRLCNGHTIRQSLSGSSCFCCFVSWHLSGWAHLQGQEGIHTARLCPRAAAQKQDLRGAFCQLLVLKPQAMESDKNHLQTNVSKSPFPLEGPSHWKGSHQHVLAPFFRACPEASECWLQVREVETGPGGPGSAETLEAGITYYFLDFLFFFTQQDHLTLSPLGRETEARMIHVLTQDPSTHLLPPQK